MGRSIGPDFFLLRESSRDMCHLFDGNLNLGARSPIFSKLNPQVPARGLASACSVVDFSDPSDE